MIEQLKKMLIRHEALRLKPYKDSVGKLTIGVGRNLDDRGITEAEAMLLLSNDIGSAMNDAQSFPWFKALDSVRQDVVLDMLFNLGKQRFSGFRKMIIAIENTGYPRAADEMLDSKWAQQVGLRATELSQMMRTGSYKEGA